MAVSDGGAVNFERREAPFTHFVDTAFVSLEVVQRINAAWPAQDDERWHHERRDYARKSGMLFPHRLPPEASLLATTMYSEVTRLKLSDLLGFYVHADPWFRDGPLMPRVGGGLHEITRGGMLGIHTDFDGHPTGLTRCANLLIYLNEDWDEAWGGALELHGDTVATIPVHAGTAVLFQTNGKSWHGHPHPLKCPEDRSRRSLALYYYRKPTGPHERITTVYR